MTLATRSTSPSSRGPGLRPFTVEEYHQMILAGILKEDDPVELLEGWIVYKVTHNPLHDATVDQVQEAIRNRISKDWRIRVQSAITTSDSEPEPDVVVAQGPATRYAKRHPGPADIALLIEVADSSLDRDRNEKAPLYARAGIALYWIVNLQESVVEVYSDPAGPTLVPKYQKLERFGINDSVSLTIGGQIIAPIPVTEILP